VCTPDFPLRRVKLDEGWQLVMKYVHVYRRRLKFDNVPTGLLSAERLNRCVQVVETSICGGSRQLARGVVELSRLGNFPDLHHGHRCPASRSRSWAVSTVGCVRLFARDAISQHPEFSRSRKETSVVQKPAASPAPCFSPRMAASRARTGQGIIRWVTGHRSQSRWSCSRRGKIELPGLSARATGHARAWRRPEVIPRFFFSTASSTGLAVAVFLLHCWATRTDFVRKAPDRFNKLSAAGDHQDRRPLRNAAGCG